jgi:hypothetical protein
LFSAGISAASHRLQDPSYEGSPSTGASEAANEKATFSRDPSGLCFDALKTQYRLALQSQLKGECSPETIALLERELKQRATTID